MSNDPTAESWRYNPSPGQWSLDRPPTRDEALLMAAECATAANDNTIPAAAGTVRAEAAKAWAAIAAVAPTDRLHLADFAMPTTPGRGEAIKMCGRGVPDDLMRDGFPPYRCTEPADHPDDHRATLAGRTLARWS